ncbi:MAG: aminotransferase class I/II-fold pyridoxal phosphate-dependent enzyme, partial [Bacteroidota bacterium]
IVEVPLTNNFQPNVEAVLEAVNPSTKMLFICSPNNPTGNSMHTEKVKQLITGFPGIVVVDEAYIDFAAQGSLTPWIDNYSNLVILQTFSKAWGLAGIRLGMAFAQEWIVELFNKVKPPYNINKLTQEAVLEKLIQGNAIQEEITTVLGQRALLQQYLSSLEYIEKIYPSDTNFILLKVKEPTRLYDFLVDKGIIVRDRSKVLLCEGCLRISVGTPQENERLFNAMLEF